MRRPCAVSRFRSRAGFAAAVLLASSTLPAAPQEMTETVLDNGLRVVLRPVRTNPVVCSAVLVRAGVAWEPDGMSGASHFLEHLLFNGTETRTQEQLYADVDRIGAYNNATTRSDHTLYMLLAPAEHLDRALEIQADMLLHSTLPEDKFEKEKGIVLEEMGRDSTDPAHLADLFFDSRAFAGSPYARPVLGTVESIRGLRRDAVLSYYRDRYVPQRMVVFLAGDFDEGAALAKIRRHFGGDTLAGTEPAAPDTALPAASLALSSTAKIYHHRLEAGRTYLRAAFSAPADGDPDAEAFGLLIALAAAGDSSPLGVALKAGAAPAVYDFSLQHATTGGAGALLLSATLTGNVAAEEVIRRTLAAIDRAVRDRLVTSEDLRARREASLTESALLEEQVHYYAMFRAPRLLGRSAEELGAAARRVDAIGIAELERATERFRADRRGIVGVSGPEQADGAVGTFDLASATTGLGGTGPGAEIAADDERIVLDNGLTVSIHADPSASVFAAHVIARNRSALEPPERPGLADLLHRLLLRGSLARDAGALEASIQRLGINLKLFDDPRFPFDDYQTTPAFSFVRLEARVERAAEALGLLAEMLQTPRIDPEDLDRARAEMADLTTRRAESSGTIASSLFLELVAPGHPLSRPVGGTSASLDGIGRDELLAFHRRLFAPENLILSIRGAGPRELLARRVRETFGGNGPAGGWSLPGGGASATRSPTPLQALPAVTAAPARQERAVGKRQSALRLGAVIEVPPADRPALGVVNLLLSDRLQLDLRETQGLAYSIGSSLTQLGGDRLLVQIGIGTAPDNLELAETEIRRVINELREAPAPAEELEKVVAARVGRMLMRRLTSINQAYYDGLELLFARPTEGSLAFLETLGSVTPAQAHAAARRYLEPGGWVVAIAR